jgi:hypothetical protein
MRSETLTFVETINDDTNLKSRVTMTLEQPLVLNNCDVALTRIMFSPLDSRKVKNYKLTIVGRDASSQFDVDLSSDPVFDSPSVGSPL